MNRQVALLSGLVGLLVLVGFYFLALAPAIAEEAEVREQVDAELDQHRVLEAQIRRLKEIRDEAPAFEARLAAAAAVLPPDPGMPSILRNLQVAADESGVRLDLVGSSREGTLAAEGPGAGLAVVDMTLQMSGSYFQMVDFLRRLEDPRLTARGITWRLLAIDEDEYPTLLATLGISVYYTTPVPVEADEDGDGPSAASAANAASDSDAATDASDPDGAALSLGRTDR